MKRALLSTLLIAGTAMAGGKRLHPDVAIDDPPTNLVMVRANCVDAEDAAGQVLEALGFKYGSGSSRGNLGRTYYHFRTATRDWKDAAAKVGKSVNLSGGLLDIWYDVRPTEADLFSAQGWTPEKKYSCQMRLNLEWVGLKRGFVLEGYEYVQSTKAMENLILNLVRYHLDAQGKLAKD
jgi:hypothetical protein